MLMKKSILPIIGFCFCGVVLSDIHAADNPVEALCETYQVKCEEAKSNTDKCNVWQDEPFQAELGNYKDKGLDWRRPEQHAFFSKTLNCNFKDVNSSTCKEIGGLCLKFAGTYVKP